VNGNRLRIVAGQPAIEGRPDSARPGFQRRS
jgi:hypothetical protein